MAPKMAFFAPGLYRLQKTRLSFFECFPYVCLETVLVNRSGFCKCKNGIAQKTRSNERSEWGDHPVFRTRHNRRRKLRDRSGALSLLF